MALGPVIYAPAHLIASETLIFRPLCEVLRADVISSCEQWRAACVHAALASFCVVRREGSKKTPVCTSHNDPGAKNTYLTMRHNRLY